MGLLKPAMNHTAYLKLGIQGFEGSGKTYLANDFAVGLTKLVKGTKVAFFDTEKGSDFYIKKYKDAGVELHVVRSRAFVDLLTTIREAEQNQFSFLIIDSITHVWRELSASYLKKTGKTKMNMHGWMTLKAEWAQFTDLYVNSKLHIVMCGRAGYEYNIDEDEDGKQEIVKSGTKMKAEGETGFEPDLLIETYKVPMAEMLTDRKQKKNAKGFVNRCVVIKDRSDLLNGKIIDKPKFENFLPIVKFLNLGGEHLSVTGANNSQALFGNPDRSWAEMDKLRAIALEEIKECFVLKELDGTSGEVKKKRTETLIKIFGTSAWTAIENMKLVELRDGVDRLKVELGIKKLPPGVDDDVPFFDPDKMTSRVEGKPAESVA